MMIRKMSVLIWFLLPGTMLPLPALAQDDLPLNTPKPTFYSVGEIGHFNVPTSVIQAAELDTKADVLRKAGNPEAAQKLYRQAISVAPLLDAYFHYADILAAKGNAAKAADIYRFVMLPLPKTPEGQGALQPITLFRLALYLSQAGKTREALNVYQFAAFDNGGNDGGLPKLDFINKQGFDGVLFAAACHLGTGFELANCSDPDYPSGFPSNDLMAIPADRKEFVEATRIKPDWAKSWLALATEMEKEVSENYGFTPKQISNNVQLGREAAIRYLELAERPDSGEAPLNIEVVESWRDRCFNPIWRQSQGK